MKYRITIAALILIGLALAISQKNSSFKIRLPGTEYPLKSVQLSQDIEVDAGGAACSFSGYVWTCESCAVPPSRIPKPRFEGDPTSIEFITPDQSTIDLDSSTEDFILQLAPITPELPGCIDVPHSIEVRAMDDSQILFSDTMLVNVRCCGV